MAMTGKIVVATGATSGIGAVAVDTLARQGARIHFVARDEARAKATLDRLEKLAPGLGHRAHFADLASIAETKRAAAEIVAAEPKIDLLINNAGAVFSNRRISIEGLELTFALNHMSYFTLTKSLLEPLKAAGSARIVSTSSRAHMQAKFNIDDLQSQRGYSGYGTYGASKLENILFTRELARRLAGTGVTANCFHPGVVATRFASQAGGMFQTVIGLLRPFFLTPEQGADTLLWLATSPDVATLSGEYFAKRKPAKVRADGRDDALAAKLWAASEALYAAH
jgi:NAD(P)-dependent dehydrogenase (short-subunit alcohol dehydrogenase family)